MERVLDVPTAEALDLHYELAGLGSRFLAVAIDFAVQTAVALAIFLIVAFAGPSLAGAGSGVAARSLSAVGIALVAIALFVLYFGYFIVFELVWNGRSPGKRFVGLRVIRSGGSPVDVNASVIRNVVRLLEVAFGCYLVSAVVALRSPRNQRIGDYAAATIVVVDAPSDASIDELLALPIDDLGDCLSTTDRELIGQFLARRAQFDAGARPAVAAAIATRVRPKLAASFAHLDDESLLEHLGRA